MACMLGFLLSMHVIATMTTHENDNRKIKTTKEQLVFPSSFCMHSCGSLRQEFLCQHNVPKSLKKLTPISSTLSFMTVLFKEIIMWLLWYFQQTFIKLFTITYLGFILLTDSVYLPFKVMFHMKLLIVDLFLDFQTGPQQKIPTLRRMLPFSFEEGIEIVAFIALGLTLALSSIFITICKGHNYAITTAYSSMMNI